MTVRPPDLLRLRPRPSDSHKGDFGRVLLIGGSTGMAGAIALAGMACLRSGAGLVRLAVPQGCQSIVAGYEPSYMVAAPPEDDQGRITALSRKPLMEHIAWSTVVACGPGLGRSPDLDQLVHKLYVEVDRPMILDADALNALATQRVLAKPVAARILTPHPGEFGRLLGRDGLKSRDDQEIAAGKLAAETGTVIVLKGHHTLITDGRNSAHNTTGNPGMATGGTGDVLTGVIAALVAQDLSPYDAARLGTHVHGLAGDLAAEVVGQVSLIASDLVRFLPSAFRRLEAASG